MDETGLDPTRDREAFLRRPIEPDPVIEAYKQHIDRTLIRENLKLTPEQRLQKLMHLQRFADELRAAGRRARQGGA
jgi:hypothetical protein